jgi:hypothetical protein
MDVDINRSQPAMTVTYSNFNNSGTSNVRIIPNANFYNGTQVTSGQTAALYIKLAPMEVQILTPLAASTPG